MKNFDLKSISLQNINDWPLPLKALAFLVIFLVTFYLGYWFDLSGKSKELQRITKKEQSIKEQVEFVIGKNKSLQKEVSRLPELQEMLSTWKGQLVPYNDLPDLLNEVLKLGGDNHLYFSSFTPGSSEKITPEEDKKADQQAAANPAAQPQAQTPAADQKEPVSYVKVPIKVVVVGSYHDISHFISQVANMKWIVAIDSFTISRESNANLLGERLAKQVDTQKLLTAELEFDVYHLPQGR